MLLSWMALSLGLLFRLLNDSRQQRNFLRMPMSFGTFLIVAITHVAGVILHSLGHKDRIGLSMVMVVKWVEGQLELIDRTEESPYFFKRLLAICLHLGRNYGCHYKRFTSLWQNFQLYESGRAKGTKMSEGNATKTAQDGWTRTESNRWRAKNVVLSRSF